MSSETSTRSDSSLQPWQFFVMAALGCATAAVYIARGQGTTAVVLLSIVIGATVLIALAVLRVLRPLVLGADDRVPMVGRRTRAALEREKMLALRAIKELEFDRAMGKLSEPDWREMSTRLRARATRLMRQLDASSGYREQIERDLQKRLGQPAAAREAARTSECLACATVNDGDARFCKSCGQKL